MHTEERNTIFQHAKDWILEAGENIRKKINDPMVVETKSNAKDLVTEFDRETEYFLSQKIKETFKDHKLLSEEGYGENLETLDGWVWIVDPIDGTMNFVKQKRNFAISIGIFHNGVGEIGLVYDVMAGNLYTALRGNGAYRNDEKLPEMPKDLKLDEAVLDFNHKWLCENEVIDERTIQKLANKVLGVRSYVSAALAFAFLAEGIIDGYLAMNLAPWDIAGGMVIAKEVGAITTDLDGNPVNMLERTSSLTCHPAIHQEIIQEYMQVGRK